MINSKRIHTTTTPPEGFTLEDSPLLWNMYMGGESITFVREDGSTLHTKDIVVAGAFLKLLEKADVPINPILNFAPVTVRDSRYPSDKPKESLKWAF